VTDRIAPLLEIFPLHLGSSGSVVPLPAFPPGTEAEQWYADYGARFADDAGGRLVSAFRFDADWTSWEMHPAGAELVICTEGSFTLIQQDAAGGETRIRLGPGTHATNPAGIWHTADAAGPATAIFITPGEGTCHRMR
jgi:hypothetical protein